MKALLVILLLVGCQSVPLEERALYCDDEVEEDCQRLRDRADERYYEREPKCPDGYVLFTDSFGQQCVSERTIRLWMQGMYLR